MREKKFRAWDKQEGKWLDISYLFLDCNGKVIGYTVKGETYTIDKIDLVEYTGLKDKNGREIYEGDIVQSTSNFVKLETNEPTGKMCRETYQIIYVEESAYFTTQTIKGQHPKGYVRPFRMSQEIISKHYEVIGNIYENPEEAKE